MKAVVASLMAAAELTATGAGDAVDIVEFDGHGLVVMNSSAGGGADHTLDMKLQHSDNGDDGWEDVPGAAFTQVTNAAASHQSLGLNLGELKRYVRPHRTLAGTSPSFTVAMSIVGVTTYMG